MKFLQVNYARALPRDDENQAAGMAKAAEKISGVPGLLWKIWGYDDEQRRAAGLYLFVDEASARAWAEGPMIPALSSHPGISDIQVTYFDIDETLSAITRGPLG